MRFLREKGILMNAILSIKPKYADRIFRKEKSYEFRKKVFTKNVDKIYVYSTNPIKKILGYILSDGIIIDHPVDLWYKLSNKKPGINKEEFFSYFGDKSKAYAIIINKIYPFNEPLDPFKIFDKFVPPQSFIYIKNCL